MNALTILKDGHQAVVEAVDGLAETEWHTPGACGDWSVKDIIAHLASFEHALVDVLRQLLDSNAATPTLDRFTHDYVNFNTNEVAQRADNSVTKVWQEYEKAHVQTLALLAQMPQEMQRENGRLPWYGAEYDLEDFIVYTFYGHKREHSAQIGVFRDQFIVTPA